MKAAFIIIFIFISNILFSQCVPQEDLPLDQVGLFPLPFGVIPAEDGGVGITDTAYLGEPFEYTFTLIFPDTFINPVTNSQTIGRTIEIIPDSTRILFDEVLSNEFPNGLSLEVNPPDSILVGNSTEPVGCMSIIGTPESDVVTGDYLITFLASGCVFNEATNFDDCVNIEIPGLFINILGEYRLTILDRTSATKDVLNDKVGLSISPNPMSDYSTIIFNGETLTGDYNYELYNASGQKVRSDIIRPSNKTQIIVRRHDLDPGMYVVKLEGAEGIISSKLVIQ